LATDRWGRLGHAATARNFWPDPARDRVERVDYAVCSVGEFVRRFEAPGVPAVIRGATDDWQATTDWHPERLAQRFHNEKFKVGEDDDGDAVHVQMADFLRYSLLPAFPDAAASRPSRRPVGLACHDDSPLYIFDGNFGDRSRANTANDIEAARRKRKENAAARRAEEVLSESGRPGSPPKDMGPETDSMSAAAASVDNKRNSIAGPLPPLASLTGLSGPPHTDGNVAGPLNPMQSSMLKDYKVPKYFVDDLFQYTGSRRPPYRWVVIGPARSGTGIHMANKVTTPNLPDREASTWFAFVYPALVDESTRCQETGTLLADRLGMVEILQRP
ncbi:jumonji domain-containing protein 6, partial [Cladochytrium tenue]